MNQQHIGEDGQPRIYDLSKGKFAVTIGTGPAYATRRQEAATSAIELFKVAPQPLLPALPEIIRMFDWPKKDAIAKLVEKALPPALQPQDPNAPPDDPEKLKGVITQMQAQIQTMSQALTEATNKHDSEERSEEWNTYRTQIVAQTNLAIAEAKIGSTEAIAKLEAELDHIRMVFEPQLLALKTAAVAAATPPDNSAPGSAAASPQAPAQPSPPTGNTPAEVGIGG
jgi:hypothetical protein